MKLCPVCGEVYSARATRCHAHDVPLRAWRDETDQHAVTDVERDATSYTPSGARTAAGELHAPWPTPDPGEPFADTPLVHVAEALRASPAPTRGRVLGERYRLTRQLGVGGYGAVFAAEELATRARVAIKVLTPAAAQSAELITRFHREAIAASRMRHPHVVEVADFDVDADGTHFIVMEHLDGSDLAEVLQDTPQLAPARALVIAAQCARGLGAAHRAGVLHRDLKPANVFLVRRPDGEASVKVIDFGISKLTRAAGDYTDVTSASKVVGTPCYMSPEQARGRTLDARVDVYALGVMLFEMLVGERPFTGRSPLEILAQHLDAPRVPPSQRRPELAACPGLDALVVRAMAASPASRFRSMDELLDRIMACLRAIDPVAAEQLAEITGELDEAADTQASPARRSVARAVGAVGLAAAATLAIVTFAAGPNDGARRGEDPRPRAAPARVEPVPEPVEPPPVIEPSAPAPTPVHAAPSRTVRVTSTPSGATVLSGGRVVGVTPLELELAAGDDDVAITVRARGHLDRSFVIGPDRDTIDALLEPRARAPRRPAKRSTRGVEEW